MTRECDFCDLALEVRESRCPRCGHAVNRRPTGEGIAADRSITYEKQEPFEQVEVPFHSRKGLLTRLADAITTSRRTPIPEPGRENRRIPPRLRWAVLKRDGFRCRICGRTGRETVLEMDHAVSWKGGGETSLENLQTACRDCNRGKSADSISPEVRAPIQLDDDYR